MKINFIILILFVSSKLFCAEEFIGKIIRNGEEESVTFLLPSNFRSKFNLMSGKPKFVDEIDYKDSEGNKKTLLPEKDLEIQFEENGKTVYLVSFISERFLLNQIFSEKYKMYNDKYAGREYVFWEKVHDGKMKLYTFYGMVAGKELFKDHLAPNVAQHLIIVNDTSYNISYSNGNENYNSEAIGTKFSVSRLAPKRKDIAVFFKSCPSLYNKIISGVYMNKDIDKMVEEFNTKCEDSNSANSDQNRATPSEEKLNAE